MVIAIYKRFRKKDRWILHSVADADKTIDEAKEKCKSLEEAAKKNGLEKSEFTIQVFDNDLHVPEFIKEIKPEKLMYN